jgi:predicted nuclease of predicted toxin-antitoxin system
VRVLLDECLPRKLKDSLPAHECATVPEAGLAGKKNGQLLSLAESMGFDLFLTLDKSIEYQQNLTGRRISIIVVHAKSNRLRDIQPHVPECLMQMQKITPGQLVRGG